MTFPSPRTNTLTIAKAAAFVLTISIIGAGVLGLEIGLRQPASLTARNPQTSMASNIVYRNDKYHFELRYPSTFQKDLWENDHELHLHRYDGTMGFFIVKTDSIDARIGLQDAKASPQVFHEHRKYAHVEGEFTLYGGIAGLGGRGVGQSFDFESGGYLYSFGGSYISHTDREWDAFNDFLNSFRFVEATDSTATGTIGGIHEISLFPDAAAAFRIAFRLSGNDSRNSTGSWLYREETA